MPARVWRLTVPEYQVSVARLVGKGVVTSLTPPADPQVKGYANNAGMLQMSLPVARYFADQAAFIVSGIADSDWPAMLPCPVARADCPETFIRTFVGRAFRRPPTAVDSGRYRRIFDAASDGADLHYPYRAVLEALLTSPYFLYRTEIGPAAEADRPSFRLTDHEIASLLSYSLLGAPPSPDLLERAARAELARGEGLGAAVGTMLSSGEAGRQVRSFVGQWIEAAAIDTVVKDALLFPTFDDVRPALKRESELFLNQFATLDGSHRDLLTGTVPRVAALDSFYTAVARPADRTRVGVLGLGAFQCSHAGSGRSSPTLRGKWVRERLFCQTVTPPPNVPPLGSRQPAPQTPRTTRQLYESHMMVEQCAGCHRLMDPLGFALENFDAAGRFRSSENGVPVDARSDIVATDVDRTVDGHRDLAQALAESARVRSCFATEAYRFLLGAVDEPETLPVIQASAAKFIESQRIGDLLAGLLAEPGLYVRHRN